MAKSTARRGGRENTRRGGGDQSRPRTPRGEATRAALLAAARRVFERDGFLEARITDITLEAETATGSFYSYFSTKEEIFTAVIDQLADVYGLHAVSMTYLSDSTDDLEGSIASHHRRYLESYADNAQIMSVMEEVTSISDDFRHHRTRQAQSHMFRNAETILKLQSAGIVDPELSPLQTAKCMTTMVSRSAFVCFVLEEQTAEAIDLLVDTTTRLWLSMLGVSRPATTSS